MHAHRQKYDKVRVTLEMPQNLLSPKLKVFGRVLDFIFIRSTHHVCSCVSVYYSRPINIRRQNHAFLMEVKFTLYLC